LDTLWGEQPLLDINADGSAWVTADVDGGCCGWYNEGSEQTYFRGGDTAQVVFDEWSAFGNNDYDVSFYTAAARISPDARCIALSVHATDGPGAELRLSADGHADPLELHSVQAALADMPVVEVVSSSTAFSQASSAHPHRAHRLGDGFRDRSRPEQARRGCRRAHREAAPLHDRSQNSRGRDGRAAMIRRVKPPGRSNRSVRGSLLSLSAVAIFATAGPARAAGESQHAAHYVISYFVSKSADYGPVMQWRILDPRSRVDTLFAPVDARGVYWDTTETSVEYVVGDQLFKIAWELGAQPWPVLSLPTYDSVDWWFNPDCECWQVAQLGGVTRQPAREGPPYTRCHCELWQSNADGGDWRIIATDTLDCGGCYFCETWKIRDGPRSTVVAQSASTGYGRK
jgi:hypothetical protein